MPSVTIDPGVLAAPPLGTPRENVLRYVETLLDWRSLIDEPWGAVYMSERASTILIEDGFYPLRRSLRDLFVSNGIVEYDTNTVAQLAETLLRMTPTFEDQFKVRDVLYENLSIVPDLLSIHSTVGLKTDLARCAILIALLRTHCRRPIVDHALVVRPWGGRTDVHLQALIHEVEHSRNDLLPLPVPPEYCTGSIVVCQSFREFILNIDPVVVWETASDEMGFVLAVQIALYQSRYHRGLNPVWEGIIDFRLGRQFTGTANACCRNNPQALLRSVLRAMVETIDRLQLKDVHALRISDSGGAPQRTRGDDKAWRRDIDVEYHLHYWECEDGIEFGSVGPHNDFSIPA